MNKLIQYSKILSFGFLFTFFLSSCSKDEPIEKGAPVLCDFVTINMTNSLNSEISGVSINGVSVGDIQSGETISEICLDNLMADMTSNFIALQIIGEYDGELLGEEFGYCGVGMYLRDTGVFNIDITDTYELGFIYSTQ